MTSDSSAPGGKPEAVDGVTILPDGSAFFTASFPLPADHWITAAHRNVPPMPLRMGEGPERNAMADNVRAAARYAVRTATMNGKENDFDPDALVQNMIVGLLGYWTDDGASSDAWDNPDPLPRLAETQRSSHANGSDEPMHAAGGRTPPGAIPGTNLAQGAIMSNDEIRLLAFKRALNTFQNYAFRFANEPNQENEVLMARITAELEALFLTETQRSSSGARSDETTETGEVGVPAEPALTEHLKFLITVRSAVWQSWNLSPEGRALIVRFDAALAALAHRPALTDALALAIRFHETYERLAPSFGYETRRDTKVFDPESKNGKLMIAVCGALAHRSTPEPADKP